ncbi:LysR family transcriptional regulator [Burkholderia stagnalis]|uniref:LysR family transcriptional regulator n=1 Tax=Burkholderia stagnalis TaxID=1503054 RepID=A0A119H052_9BURK|nr:LysR family transcriptional regulator [Burkholderia stagnalis]KVZ02673.1 LysR family transcriptional regulator [Burkholderia stagnalis]KWA53788.1 LysR family transcriptional regulator [Burkholderia stagnalis]KWA58902.1 LysR family transcriptional regulator [Burkholderia stagnalis]KWA60790.1 LysR family transcriptional regulator [Burkholderia stagnalis]KWC97666.1 LysR family transcriptional regulator [Burkholderia stagnalis]
MSQHLPPLGALRAFEAAVRLGGFARAAAELNVSTSAVSHQIRALEEALGARLLERSTGLGGIGLTPAGARLLPAVSDALSRLTDACAEIRGTAHRLTVSANAPFSSMWLARRLAEFSSLHPETPLHAVVLDDEPDFARGSVDLAIVHVPAHRLTADDDVLLQESVFPVCSPELYPFASGAVCRCRLLQEMHENSPEIDWRNWSAEFGLPGDFETKIVRYSSFSQVIGAAVGGAGIALGRAPLIEPELRSGRLVPLVRGLERAASWRFVLRRNPSTRHRLLDPLVAFLRQEAAATPVTATMVAPASNDAHARDAGGA